MADDFIVSALQAIERLEEAGQHQLAMGDCEALSRAYPERWDVFYHLGNLRFNLGEFRRAESAYLRAVALEPGHAWTHFRLGMLMASLRRTAAASEHFRRALELAPEAMEARINLCAVLQRERQLAAARRCARPFDGMALPDWWAETYRTIGLEFAECRRAVREALAARPTDDQTWLELAMRLGRIGRHRAALQLIDRVEANMGSSVMASVRRAEVVMHSKGIDQAIAMLRSRESTQGDDPDFLRTLARLCYAAGQNDVVISLSSRLDEANWDDEFRALVSFAYLQMDRIEDLFALSRRCLETSDPISYRLALAGLIARADVQFTTGGPARRSDGAGAVPEVLVQFWDRKDIPSDVREAMSTWSRLHPQYSHKIFDEESARDFIALAHGDRAARCFDLCFHPAMKADFFRAAYLIDQGGIYVDADEACLRSVDGLRQTLGQGELMLALAPGAEPYLHNYFIIARPGALALQRAFATMMDAIDGMAAAGGRADIWQTTGPGQITRAVVMQILTTPTSANRYHLLPERQYRSYASTLMDLTYKTRQEGNWRIA